MRQIRILPVLTYFKSLIPVVMAGIIAVYSLVISVLIAGDMKPPTENDTNNLFKYGSLLV